MRITTRRAAKKPLMRLTAADLMSAPVTTIPHDMPLREAGQLLFNSQITGAPVVDAAGRCIGILSSSDFVVFADRDGEIEETRKAVSFIAPWGEIVSLDSCEDCIVSHYMTTQPVAVGRSATIGEIARKMVDAHIHRVLVSDHDEACGVVSSTDIMAAVANADRAAE